MNAHKRVNPAPASESSEYSRALKKKVTDVTLPPLRMLQPTPASVPFLRLVIRNLSHELRFVNCILDIFLRLLDLDWLSDCVFLLPPDAVWILDFPLGFFPVPYFSRPFFPSATVPLFSGLCRLGRLNGVCSAPARSPIRTRMKSAFSVLGLDI